MIFTKITLFFNQERNHWGATPTSSFNEGGSSWRSWVIPVAVALTATFLYRFYLYYSTN